MAKAFKVPATRKMKTFSLLEGEETRVIGYMAPNYSITVCNKDISIANFSLQ